jgi:hypothetical protein
VSPLLLPSVSRMPAEAHVQVQTMHGNAVVLLLLISAGTKNARLSTAKIIFAKAKSDKPPVMAKTRKKLAVVLSLNLHASRMLVRPSARTILCAKIPLAEVHVYTKSMQYAAVHVYTKSMQYAAVVVRSMGA